MAPIVPDRQGGAAPPVAFAPAHGLSATPTSRNITELAFVPVWAPLVYVPVTHWVRGPGGWVLNKLGALGFAGGLPVEVTSGASGLTRCLVLGPRLGLRSVRS